MLWGVGEGFGELWSLLGGVGEGCEGLLVGEVCEGLLVGEVCEGLLVAGER